MYFVGYLCIWLQCHGNAMLNYNADFTFCITISTVKIASSFCEISYRDAVTLCVPTDFADDERCEDEEGDGEFEGGRLEDDDEGDTEAGLVARAASRRATLDAHGVVQRHVTDEQAAGRRAEREHGRQLRGHT